MNLNRNFERFIKFVLDECLPPILRESRFIMWLPFRLAFGDKADLFFDFKSKAALMSREEITEIYAKTSSVHIQQDGTDLTDQIIEKIKSNVTGNSLLDVGCGKGILAGILRQQISVTATDILIDPKTIEEYADVHFEQANVERLPFDNSKFDTVTCTHTLEHVQDLQMAFNELWRVTKKRLIVVLPKERPYEYTFNLHLHFFPSQFTVLSSLQQVDATSSLRDVDGCWYYQLDCSQE